MSDAPLEDVDNLEEPEVTDLDEARHIIAALRRRIAELEETAPTTNNFWIEVSDEDAMHLQVLYDDGTLTYEQRDGPGMELDEAPMDFLRGRSMWHGIWHIGMLTRLSR